MSNRGVLLGQRDTDWVAGSATGLSFQERNPSGDWRPYLVAKEYQKGKEDSMSCVSFSACSSIEIQEKFLTGKENNYSDRWIAVRSGTMPSGNYLYKVGDTVRNDGMVLETDYPAPPNYTWNEYHQPIQEPKLSELIAKGKAWLGRWQVNTEFVPTDRDSLLKHLKHAPVQLVIPGHAVVGFLCERDVINYFDTYKPFEKKTAYSGLQSAYKYVLTERTTMKLVNDKGTIYLVAGVNNKVKLGIADPETLALFGDEPIIEATTDGIAQTQTISKGFVLHKA